MKYKAKIILWDNDGTITASKNPNDRTSRAKIILPGIKEEMSNAQFNFVISGFKSQESESQNFDPEEITTKFIDLMSKLPINAVAFSPIIGGTACYLIIKKNHQIIIKKAHENPNYHQYIGKFKKPDIGMFVVMKDAALEEFGQIIEKQNTIMIGDTWHDEVAAKTFGIPFINAEIIHSK